MRSQTQQMWDNSLERNFHNFISNTKMAGDFEGLLPVDILQFMD